MDAWTKMCGKYSGLSAPKWYVSIHFIPRVISAVNQQLVIDIGKSADYFSVISFCLHTIEYSDVLNLLKINTVN